MPRITRTFIKTGLVYFLLSLLLGIAIEIESLQWPFLTLLFWHMLMVGWITQIIFGVSLWMFPDRTREEGLKPQLWGWLTYLFLNSGLLLRDYCRTLAQLFRGRNVEYSNHNIGHYAGFCSHHLHY